MLTFLLVLARMAGLVSAHRLTAITDGLTRLRTRGHFTEVLRAESERARRANQPIGLIIVDADHFKHINDTWGHPAGDDVLVEIAERLKSVSHAPDTVARYGGEEFAILVPGAGDAEIEALGERIRLTIGDRPIRVNRDRELPVTVSVGAVSLRGDQADPERLVRAADQALYAAKREGRNLVRSLAPA